MNLGIGRVMSPRLRYALTSTAVASIIVGAVIWEGYRETLQLFGFAVFILCVFVLALYLYGKVD